MSRNKKPAQKHERETLRAVHKLHPQIRAGVEVRTTSNTHKWLIAELEGKTVRVSVGSSPSNPDGSVRECVRCVTRQFRELGVELKPNKDKPT